jgi:hypothetical protein
VREAFPDVRVVAYADDVHLQGPPEAAIEAFRLLVTATAPIGLTPSLSKCAANAQSAATGLAVASALGIAHRPEGLVAAGTTLGSDAFVETDARSRAETVAGLVTALASFPLGRQDKFLLLRSSLQVRLTHLTRITRGRGSPPTSLSPGGRCFMPPSTWWSTLLPLTCSWSLWSRSSPFPCAPAGLACGSPPPRGRCCLLGSGPRC